MPVDTVSQQLDEHTAEVIQFLWQASRQIYQIQREQFVDLQSIFLSLSQTDNEHRPSRKLGVVQALVQEAAVPV